MLLIRINLAAQHDISHSLTLISLLFQQAETIIGPRLHQNELDYKSLWYNIIARIACY